MSHGGEWLLAGRVGRPHGLDGSFHVTRPAAELLAGCTVVQIGGRELQVTRRAGTDQRMILRVEGHEDRAGAESLKGQEIRVARTSAPVLDQDEWLAEDLEGCEVHDAGHAVGVVKRLVALPSCEVLEVARADGSGELLVPLVRDAVRDVDVAGRKIEVDLRFLGEG